MNNFVCKAKSNFCHTYWLNWLEEQVENWYIHYQRDAFWCLEMNQVEDRRDKKLYLRNLGKIP